MSKQTVVVAGAVASAAASECQNLASISQEKNSSKIVTKCHVELAATMSKNVFPPYERSSRSSSC